jgi:hypothetical protein
VNTTTAAKVIASDTRSLTVIIDNGIERYRRRGVVTIDHGLAYLTVDKNTLHEYAICLGGAHTPIEYV